MEHIVIAIDFSDVTGKLIDMGIKLAKAFNARVSLVHTEPPNSGYVLYDYGGGMSPGLVGFYHSYPVIDDQEHKEIIKNDRQALELLCKQFSDNNIQAESYLLEGVAVDCLLDMANNSSADLIIIGNHKHGRFYNFIFNDIGQNIISHSNCNVLVVETETASV